MNEPRRLFDFFEQQLEQSPNSTLLAAKESGQWRTYATIEVKSIVDQLSAGLLALGISSGDMSVEGRDKIALLAKNRPEWIFLDLAVQQIGAVLVPLYPTAHVNDVAFILNDAHVKMVFVNDEEIFQKINTVLPNTPSVQKVFSFEQVQGAIHWKELLTMGKQEHYEQIALQAQKINTEDLFTIIYTSGTTGTPKGVMLSHHNVLSNVMSTRHYLPVHQHTRVLSFLPLNHIFERTVSYVYLFCGCAIYYAENLDALGENIREVRPHMFTTVPRLLEKVYERIMAKANELSPVKRKLFNWALHLGERYKPGKTDPFYRLQLALARKLVFSKWREGLGNSLSCIVTGAAACQVKLIRIFTAAGIPILEGYGQTESSPVISVNRLDEKLRMFGTVGPIIDGVEVKIAADGEILCKGPNVMMGYYNRPDLTAETVVDGWLHTGDIGVLVDNTFLKITDRKKEIFKTSGGKYVAPQAIENKLVESPYIEQVMVVGAGEKFVGALIVPAFKVIKEWSATAGINLPEKREELICHPEVLKLFSTIIEEHNKLFNHVEQIKKFELLPVEWSIEKEEMTPTLKLRRKVIMERFRYAIDRIYERNIE